MACKEQSRNAYRVLVGRPEGKRLLGRPGRRWEDNIGMDLGKVSYFPVYKKHFFTLKIHLKNGVRVFTMKVKIISSFQSCTHSLLCSMTFVAG